MPVRNRAGRACSEDTFTDEEGLQPIADLSCSRQDGLPAGATAPAMTVSVHYRPHLVGPQQVGAEVTQSQGEPDDALADNRSSQTTTLAAATPMPAPSSTPTVSGPHTPLLGPQSTPTLPATGPTPASLRPNCPSPASAARLGSP